jgi:hypothetical protein
MRIYFDVFLAVLAGFSIGVLLTVSYLTRELSRFPLKMEEAKGEKWNTL